MPLLASSAEVAHREGHPIQFGDAPPPTLQMVHGQNGSMAFGWRPPDYHSAPHVHDREQFNYQLEGELWIFVGEEGYLMKPGDFMRIPPMAVHWAWNRSGEPTSCLEFHIPGQQDEPMLDGESVPLFAADEVDNHVRTPATTFLDPVEHRREEIETAAIAAEEAKASAAARL